MYRLLAFVGLSLAIAYAVSDDEVRQLKNNLEDVERKLSSLGEEAIRIARNNVDHKVSQASRKGRSSEDCARKAGMEYLKNVRKANDSSLTPLQKELREIRKNIEDKKIGEKGIKDLIENIRERVFNKAESVMTKNGADTEILAKNYARDANKC